MTQSRELKSGLTFRERIFHKESSMDRLARKNEWFARAEKVIPGGMYGHQSVKYLTEDFPLYFAKAKGSHLWDVDGNQYIDYVCGYGTNLFGYGNERIEQAAALQLQKIDTATNSQRGDGSACRGAHSTGQPRRLGDVLQERLGRHVDGHGDLARVSREAEDPRCARHVPWCIPVERTLYDGDYQGRPRSRRLLRVQRYREPQRRRQERRR